MPNPVSSAGHIDAALTNISEAYLQSAENFIAMRAFPLVPVQKKSDLYFIYNKGDFLRDELKPRADGTESAQLGYRLSTSSYLTEREGGHIMVTEEVRANFDDPLDPERDAAAFLAQKGLIRLERQWVTDFFSTSVWGGTDQTGVAGVPAANQFKQWDQIAATPIEDIRKQTAEILKSTGLMPNTLVLSFEVWNKLQDHASFLERVQQTQTGIMTEDLLANILGIKRVLISRSIHDTANEGATVSTAFIAGKSALLAYVTPTASLRTPTAGYTFTWKGLLGGTESGQRIRRVDMSHIDEGATKIEIDLAYDQKVIAAEAGRFFDQAVV